MANESSRRLGTSGVQLIEYRTSPFTNHQSFQGQNMLLQIDETHGEHGD
jgi:hypothetical protein